MAPTVYMFAHLSTHEVRLYGLQEKRPTAKSPAWGLYQWKIEILKFNCVQGGKEGRVTFK